MLIANAIVNKVMHTLSYIIKYKQHYNPRKKNCFSIKMEDFSKRGIFVKIFIWRGSIFKKSLYKIYTLIKISTRKRNVISYQNRGIFHKRLPYVKFSLLKEEVKSDFFRKKLFFYLYLKYSIKQNIMLEKIKFYFPRLKRTQEMTAKNSHCFNNIFKLLLPFALSEIAISYQYLCQIMIKLNLKRVYRETKIIIGLTKMERCCRGIICRMKLNRTSR